MQMTALRTTSGLPWIASPMMWHSRSTSCATRVMPSAGLANACSSDVMRFADRLELCGRWVGQLEVRLDPIVVAGVVVVPGDLDGPGPGRVQGAGGDDGAVTGRVGARGRPAVRAVLL